MSGFRLGPVWERIPPDAALARIDAIPPAAAGLGLHPCSGGMVDHLRERVRHGDLQMWRCGMRRIVVNGG